MTKPAPLGALFTGLVDVLRAPLVLVAVAIVMLLVTVPFAAVLQSRLQASLSVQPQISIDDAEIDADWWMEFRKHAQGLEATFTPAVLGFAATLDGLSNVLDGKAVPAGLIAPLILSIVAWSFLWGGILERFHARQAIGTSRFIRGGARHFTGFIVIAVIALVLNLLLYLTVHRLLFGPVHTALVAMTSTERDAFLVRIILYLLFFALIAGVSVLADYARVAAVANRTSSPLVLLRISWTFIRRHPGAVIVLYLATGAIFVLMTAGYGVLEVAGGSQVGGWAAVAIGQAYVLVRLAIRLTFAASELRLFSAAQTATAE